LLQAKVIILEVLEPYKRFPNITEKRNLLIISYIARRIATFRTNILLHFIKIFRFFETENLFK
jgi:hypothetical protein